MFTDERHQLIKELLEEQNVVKMQDIVQRTGSSESTIRRDLSMLEEAGICVRVHGGAKRGYKLSSEPEMQTKSQLHIDDKRLIAAKAVSFIEAEEVIFLDAGSTTFEMIPLLQGLDVLVVTNGVPHASLLADLKIPSLLVGGKIKWQTKATIGPSCIKQLEEYRFSKAFLGMNGVDVSYGFTTPDVEEAAVKKKAIEQSAHSFVLVDSSKFKEVTFAKVADVDDCDVISSGLDARMRKNVTEKTTYWEATE